MFNILFVEASPNPEKSISSKYGRLLLDKISKNNSTIGIQKLNLNTNKPAFVDQDWIKWNYGDKNNFDGNSIETMTANDAFCDQLMECDYLIISTPIYNFSTPAILKAWMDHLAIPRKTFAFQEGKSIGLLTNLKKIIIVTSSSQTLDSMAKENKDHFSNMMKSFWEFLGIENIEIISFSDRDEVWNGEQEVKLELIYTQ